MYSLRIHFITTDNDIIIYYSQHELTKYHMIQLMRQAGLGG